MTAFSISFHDGSVLPVEVTWTTGPTPPTNPLSPHTVKFGWQTSSQVGITLTPGAIIPPPPPAPVMVNTVKPLLTGGSGEGDTLWCSTGTWSGAAVGSFAWQWLRDGVPIFGATKNAYVTGTPDGGHAITCAITAISATAPSVTVTSSNTVNVIAPPPPTPTPVPSSGGPDIPSGIISVLGRADPGDAVMLNPAHWNMTAHSQGNGSATRNTPALAKYGQSYYGGPTDNYLHCSIGAGAGLWMVGDTLPAGSWVVEFSARCGGRDATHTYGWGLAWVLGASGQELDIFESVNWGAGVQGYGSSTYRSKLNTVVHSYYNANFPASDGNMHKYSLIWNVKTSMQYLVWGGNVVVSIPIANPSERMVLQIMTGYTPGTQPPTWSAASDNVYEYIRYWAAA